MGVLEPLGWWLLYTAPLFVVAHRSEHPYALLAFIPFANLWLMCDMADLELSWVLLILLPFLGAIIFDIMVWARLAENAGKPSWLGLLAVIPGVNLVVLYYIALAEGRA